MAIVLKLDENFTDASLPTLEGLAGWGASDGDSMEDAYGVMLYRLATPTLFNGYKLLDTHVKLYDDKDKSWTVVCAYSGELSSTQGYPYNVICCMYDAGKGLTARRGAEGEAMTVLAGTGGVRVDLAGCTENMDGANVLIVVKSGDNYSIYMNGDIAYGAPLGYGMEEADTHDATLIAGARLSSTGVPEYYTAFKLDELRIYDGALDADAVAELTSQLLGV